MSNSEILLVNKMIKDGRLDTVELGGRRLMKGNSVRAMLGVEAAS